MTTLASTIHRGSRDTTSNARTVLGGLAVALLVPALALAGLAIPLPSSVYRLAADLVERADALAVGFGADRSRTSAESETATIDLTSTVAARLGRTPPRASAPSLQSGAAPSERRRAAAVLPGGRPASASPRTAGGGAPRSPAKPTGSDAGAAPTTSPPATTPAEASAPAAEPSGGAAAPPADTKVSSPPPHTDPAPGPAPSLGDTVEGTVGTVTETVEGTVGTVQGTVEETVGTVEQTVDETVATVEDVVEKLPSAAAEAAEAAEAVDAPAVTLTRRLRAERPPLEEERAPRLVLRFAVVTALCLGVAAAAILVAVRHVNRAQAERSAAEQTRVLAESVLGDGLRSSDLAAPVAGARLAAIDDLVRRRVVRRGSSMLHVRLIRADGTITYSTDRAEIGTTSGERARVAESVGSGVVASGVSTAMIRGQRLKVLRSFVPVAGAGDVGAAMILQDYAPIEAVARQAFLPVAGILELMLILLYALLVPILARVSRRVVRQLERIRHQAYHDDLTGLPNRRFLRERLGAALAEDADRPVAVLLLDLDRFKEVNDTFGHPGGDELLRRLAERMARDLEGDLLVARLGGDELAVLALGRTSRDAVEVGREIRSIVGAPFAIDGVPVAVEAAVGVAVSPEDGRDADTLLRRADVAMYAAKGRRLGVARYDAGFDTSDRDRLALMSQLRGAIERGEIVLHYQPKVDLRTGAVCGVEALVRWQHPERGLVPPGAFVPYAEQSGLTRDLTRRVLELAVEQASAWRRAGRRVPVAVNVTMFDLLDAGFAAELDAVLARFGLPAGELQLELTESVVMSEPERVLAVLEQVSALGVGLAVDDFGTGYSSLGHLARLPVDTIKIDRSFVAALGVDEGSRAIVAATIDLGHALGLRVVAEGIEDAGAVDDLRALGCDVGQGYGLGRPVPADELTLAPALHTAA